ncbi:hypothetical protein RhiirA4_481216 [Rhizophagus irregularis]|uniref:Crinkler family protein n=1 Tax=Rhizophagus irregularis TaxID=588596 RepID=A0A2I1HJ67_9GLOM|nr:hypothetical protein RhiirA4_481216 [Rhizophagus irregularis]
MGDLDKVSTHFPTNLSSDRIHMLVQLPISKRVVTCHVKYGLKTGRFCWVVYSETRTTLKVLKDKFRHTFSIPNELKDEDINVNHETKSSELHFTIKTSQKSFSLWHFTDVKELFKLGGDSWEQLPTYEGSTMNFSVYKKTIDVIVESLLMVQKTSPNVATANEASRREYISPILHGVAYCFQNSIKIYPEHELVGSYGRGPVETIMSAFQKNRKNNHDSPSVLYGIEATALLWVILKVVLKESDNNDRPIEVDSSCGGTFWTIAMDI